MKIPRGVYYLNFSRIVKSLFSFILLDSKDNKCVLSFEEKVSSLLDVKSVTVMPHARIALYYILKFLNLKKNDEIIMSPVTLPDMLNMILILGGKPIFVDFQNLNHTISIEDLKLKISEKTKIIYLTHLYGILPDMAEIRKICNEKKIILIQDITQSYGCTYLGQSICKWADYNFSSTCSLKEIHTHMGGLILTEDESAKKIIEKLKNRDFHKLSRSYYFKFIKEDFIACLALNKYFFSFFLYYIFSYFFNKDPKILENLIDGKGIVLFKIRWFEGFFAGTGDFLRKEVPYEMKYHFSNHQALVGLEMLENFEQLQSKRIRNSEVILKGLSENAKKYLPIMRSEAGNVYWRLPIYVENIKELEHLFFKEGIDPGKTTLPCLPNLEIFRFIKQQCPIANNMGLKTVYIPNFHYLNENEIENIIRVINTYFELKNV